MLKAEIVQFAPKFKDINFNLDFIKSKVKSSIAEIVIFPEMATTGYFFTDREELKRYSFNSNYFLNYELQQISKDLNKVIIFGFPEIDGSDKIDNIDNIEKIENIEKIYNSSILISPNSNETTIYRKAHLFYKENNIFDKPSRDNLFKFSNIETLKIYADKSCKTQSLFQPVYISNFDINIGILICYDWRFPELAKEYAKNGADLIVYPSNLVTKVWENSFPARALDNRVYVAVANRVGSEENNNEILEFTGKSSLYDPNGNVLLKLSENNEETGIFEINKLNCRNKDINSINNIFEDFRADLLL